MYSLAVTPKSRGDEQKISESLSRLSEEDPTFRTLRDGQTNETVISGVGDLQGHLVFIENYDIHVARQMIAGTDVWLNTPRRPLEASGTSGMKAGCHGGLNLSILDGW